MEENCKFTSEKLTTVWKVGGAGTCIWGDGAVDRVAGREPSCRGYTKYYCKQLSAKSELSKVCYSGGWA